MLEVEILAQQMLFFVVITKSSSVHQKEAQAKYFDSNGRTGSPRDRGIGSPPASPPPCQGG